ncbi:MAG: hydrolase TatD [Gammaproteobacteria bacterium]|nr:hydrolase TatD [Gammaproteobacteria bacterium]
MTYAPPRLIDIGLNLSHSSYNSDREAVLQRSLSAGVMQIIITGTSLDSSKEAIALAKASPLMLSATAGCHPHHASSLSPEALLVLTDLAKEQNVVAVGECGLDYHRNFSPQEAQRRAFESQINLAIELRKPLFLHERDAHLDFIKILSAQRAQLPKAVIHCFTGTRAELDAYLELGLWIGITGWACDERRGLHLRDLVARIPAGRLMIETDGPYLLPRDLKPKPVSRRNEPIFLPHIAAVLAKARGEALEDFASHTTKTARDFFNLTSCP